MGTDGLQIQLLGEMRVLWNGRPEPLPASRKTRALLGYLVVTGRAHSRERLVDLLWDAPHDPRAQLRWSLWKLKRLLDRGRTGHLVADREEVAFDPTGADVDLLSVRRLLEAGVAQASTESLEKALACFRGELLEGLDLPDCYRYHEWCVGEREALRGLHVDVLSTLVARRFDSPETALRYARAWVAVDPLREEGHVEVVRLLRRLGRTREALAQYDTCRRILETELGTRPSARLELARGALSCGTPPTTWVAPQPGRQVPEERGVIALAGRRTECAIVDEFVARAVAGEGTGALLLAGEPGIGKTRLLEELGGRMRRAGGAVLYGRAFEAEQVRPYGAWVDALRPSLGPELPEPLRAQLALFLPEWPGSDRAPSNRESLFEAVLRLLARLSAERPVAVVLDDIQWLDEVSAALFHYLVRAAALPRVLFACAARAGELVENIPCLCAVRALKRERRLREVVLGPLDETATAELVRSVGADIDAGRVYSESEGNPLFALEVARALSRGGSTLSETLDQLIGDRLLLLDERVREVLPWIAAYGRRVAPEPIAEITQTPLPRVVAIFDDLERLAILRPAGDGGYDFAHDLVRRAVYQRVPPPRRRLLHLRIARRLAGMPDPAGTVAGQVAWHAAEGGDSDLCVRFCIRAGEHCLRVFAFADAEAMADLGRRHVARLPREDRIKLHLALLRILVYPGVRLRRPEGLGAELARLCGEAQEAGLVQELAAGLHLLSWMHHLSWRDFPRARATVVHTMDLVQKLPVPQNLEAIVSSARCLAVMEVHMPKARAMFEELAAYGPAVVETLFFQWGLGLVKRWAGDIPGARDALARGARLARDRGDPWAEFECASALAAVELEAGRPHAAAALCRDLRPLAAKLGEGGTEGPFVDALAALAATASGEPGGEEALEAAIRALASMDAAYTLAYVLNAAAEIDASARRWETAERRAREALDAATVSGRAPEIVRARALLARVAAAQGRVGEARRELERLEASDADQLSARARAALEEVAATCGSRSLVRS